MTAMTQFGILKRFLRKRKAVIVAIKQSCSSDFRSRVCTRYGFLSRLVLTFLTSSF